MDLIFHILILLIFSGGSVLAENSSATDPSVFSASASGLSVSPTSAAPSPEREPTVSQSSVPAPNNPPSSSNNPTASTNSALNPPYSVAPQNTADPSLAKPAPTSAPTLVQQLLQKLTLRDNRRAEVVVFSPDDGTKNKVGKNVADQVVTAFRNYGPVNARAESDVLTNLTLEEFRNLMARHKADILVGLVTRDTHFNMYLYDRRTPYSVFAHSEQIPESARATLDANNAATYTRLLIRRLLLRYLNNQFFELPREESMPVLQSEIPKWVASEASLTTLNREHVSRFYGSMVIGAALSMGRSKQIWNANLVGIQLGVRVHEKWFVEGTLTSSAYNSLTGSVKYLFANRDLPFQVTAGLGFSFVTKDKVWMLDQTIGLGKYSYYVTPSASVMWPVGDVYLKLESQVFFNLGFNQFIFTFMPGLSIYF